MVTKLLKNVLFIQVVMIALIASKSFAFGNYSLNDTNYIISDEKYDLHLKEVIALVNERVDKNEYYLRTRQYEKINFVIDIRFPNSGFPNPSKEPCVLDAININNKLNEFFELQPQTLAYYVLIDRIEPVDLVNESFIEKVFAINDPSAVDVWYVTEVRNNIKLAKERFAADVLNNSKLGLKDGCYSILTYHNFGTRPCGGENCPNEEYLTSITCFDKRLKSDVIKEFYEEANIHVESYYKDKDCGESTSCLCGAIKTEVYQTVPVLQKVFKNYEDQGYLALLEKHSKESTQILHILDDLKSFQFEKIPFDLRIKLIRTLVETPPDNINQGEYEIVRLIQYRHPDHSQSLIEYLKKDFLLEKLLSGKNPLFESIDSENYSLLIAQLCLLAYSNSDIASDAKNFAEEDLYKWKRESVSSRVETIDEWKHTCTFLENGNIDIASSYVKKHGFDNLTGYGKDFTINRTIDPFKEIGIVFIKNTDQDLFPGASLNSVYPVPAFYLIYASDKRISNENKKKTWELIKGLSFAVGVGELLAAKTAWQYFWAIAELSPTIIDEVLTIDEVRTKILKIQGGKQFLDSWDNIKNVLGTAVILRGSTLTIKSFISNYDNVAPQLKRQLDESQYNKVDSEVRKVKEKLEIETPQVDEALIKLVSSYSDDIQSFILSFEKAGARISKGNGEFVLITNLKGDEIGRIVNGKLKVSKWGAYWKYDEVIESDLGYKILKSKDGDLAIDLGFKDKRNVTAKEVNEYLIIATGKNPTGEPYFGGTYVTERILEPGEKIYCIEYKNQLQPGGWFSKHQITTIKELRQRLAVLQEWKDETMETLVVREYEVVHTIRVRDGIVGQQLELTGPNSGQTYPGGGHQYEILEGKFDDIKNPSQKFLKMLSETTLK